MSMHLKTVVLTRWLGAFALLGAFVGLARAAETYEDVAKAKAERADKVENREERRIAASDTLLIMIVGETGLPTEYRVMASGAIQFPFLELVDVKGLTPTELTDRLETLLKKDYFVDPQVLVTVKDYSPSFVRLLGQVNRPGPLQLTGEQTLDIFDVIALAGGTTRMAKHTVEFTRKGVTRTYKLDDLKKETDPAKKIYVEPGDTIEVKESVL